MVTELQEQEEQMLSQLSFFSNSHVTLKMGQGHHT